VDDALNRKAQLLIYLRIKPNMNKEKKDRLTVQDKLNMREELINKGNNLKIEPK